MLRGDETARPLEVERTNLTHAGYRTRARKIGGLSDCGHGCKDQTTVADSCLKSPFRFPFLKDLADLSVGRTDKAKGH